MVKAKDSTSQKKPAAKKATAKPRGKKALIPPQLARSASIQGRYDVAQDHALPSSIQNSDVSTSCNPTNTTSPTSVHHAPPSTTPGSPSDALKSNDSEPLNQDARLPRIVLLVGQDCSTNSKNATPKGYSPPRDTPNSDATSHVPDAETETVVDFSKNDAADPRGKTVENGPPEKSVRFCDGDGEGGRAENIAWEEREASPVIESTSSQSSKLKRKTSFDVSNSNRSASAEHKRRKGKAKAQEPAATDDRPLYQYLQPPQLSALPNQADRVYVQQAYNMNFPMVQHYTTPCLYQSSAPPWQRSGTPQGFGGMAYAGTAYHPAQTLSTPFSFQYPPPVTSSLPFSTPANVPYQYQQSVPYSRGSSVTSTHGQPPPYTHDYAPPTLRLDYAAAPAASSRPQSSMAHNFPVSNSSSSSTCVSRQSNQSFHGGEKHYEVVREPVPAQQQALASVSKQPSDSNIDPALRDDPPNYAAVPLASERLVKIEPLERIASAQAGPPSAPAIPVAPTFVLPPGVPLLDYLIHRISALSTEESMDFAFYFACCWDGGEPMIRSTSALYQQWVSASLQGTEHLVTHFTRNRQLIQTRIDYFHTHRKDRLTFNPANRKCDNCYGNSPTLPLPTKERPTGKQNRRCKDCREALLALGEDEMLFKTYTLRRRQIVAIHEEGVRKQLRDMGFPVGGRE